MLDAQTVGYVVGIPLSVLVGGMLLAIGLWITAPDTSESIRRHRTTVGRWQLPYEYVERLEGVLHPHVPAHESPSGEHLSIMEPTPAAIESWPQVGRRGAESIVRQLPVAQTWRPYTGDLRVALLETRTAEYLFARRPKDQLDTTRTQFVRAYTLVG